jgi:hypothetical protein
LADRGEGEGVSEQGAMIHVTDAQAALLTRIIRDWLDDGFSSDETELRDARKWLLVFGAIRPL